MYSFIGDILLSGSIRGQQGIFNIINLYALCHGRAHFWDCINRSGILCLDNLMIIDDYNTTLRSDESWGARARWDPMARHIGSILELVGLRDIKPSPIVFMWTNLQEDVEFIGKRLDRVMVSESILHSLGKIRSGVMV